MLIYRLGSLGDTVVALPALHLVARAFPDAERRMLTNFPINSKAPAAAEVLKGSGLVHGYFNYKAATRRLSDLAALWWQLARWRPQVLIYLAAFRGGEAVVRDARFFTLCGITKQVGVPLTEAMQKNRWQESEQALEPEAARLARNLAELGDARLDDPASWDLRLRETERETARVALADAAGMPVIAVSVGTKVQAKDWGIENWRRLLAELAAAYPEHALALCGAEEEAEASEFAAEGWRERGSAGVGNKSLRKADAAGERGGAGGGAGVHRSRQRANASGGGGAERSCVAIFAARNKPRVWFPYGKQHRVVYHQVDCWGCGLETCIVERKKCILSITVAEVLAEVRAVLG